MLWMNYDGSVDQGHISLQFCNKEPAEAISCVGRIFNVRHGNEFIQHCFRYQGNRQSSTVATMPFQAGRVQWDSMFSETFGSDFDDLMKISVDHSDPPPRSPTFSAPAENFSRLFIAGAAFFVFHTTEASRYRDVAEFVLSAMSSIPELRPCKHRLLDNAIHVEFSAMTLDELSIEYRNVRSALALTRSANDHQFTRRAFCLAKITETVAIMSYLLGRLALEGSLLPNRSGILKIYDDIREPFNMEFARESENTKLDRRYESNHLQDLLKPDESATTLIFQLARYLSIFSGDTAQFQIGGSTSAISDGKVYCFIDSLQGLSDSFEKASVIHVGAGSIQAGNRLHGRVYDQDERLESDSTIYRAQHVQLVEKSLSPFAEDSTSPDLSIKATVEESVRLSFWYHISTKLGTTLISPGSFVQSQLRKAVRFKKVSYPKTKSPDHGEEIVDHDQYISVIYGEGLAPKHYSTRIILRPHHGNILGRCIALMTSSTRIALLGSESDLSQFMKFWDHETKSSPQPASLHYTLIS